MDNDICEKFMKSTMLFDLTGKKALVTGCSRGIGQAMAIGLAEAGADIIGVSNSLRPGSETEEKVKACGRQFWSYAADMENREAVYQFIAEVKAAHPQVDILINNAGTILRNPVAQHTDAEWDKVLNINLDSPFILAREFGKEMV